MFRIPRQRLPGLCRFGATASAQSGIVYPGTTFYPGQQAYSADGRYHLDFQKDGNLALYNSGGAVLWASQTNGSSVRELRMQVDGNLVIYAANGQTLWASNTGGNPGAELRVQTDGNLVIYSRSHEMLWASQSSGGG